MPAPGGCFSCGVVCPEARFAGRLGAGRPEFELRNGPCSSDAWLGTQFLRVHECVTCFGFTVRRKYQQGFRDEEHKMTIRTAVPRKVLNLLGLCQRIVVTGTSGMGCSWDQQL
mmetsp:Transcript_105696/g.298965  ORF Transcript_105696/g.298965 Transcript_105696/m.298965 type:complete len:113 (-) Transcript_105696:8-346(-)